MRFREVGGKRVSLVGLSIRVPTSAWLVGIQRETRQRIAQSVSYAQELGVNIFDIQVPFFTNLTPRVYRWDIVELIQKNITDASTVFISVANPIGIDRAMFGWQDIPSSTRCPSEVLNLIYTVPSVFASLCGKLDRTAAFNALCASVGLFDGTAIQWEKFEDQFGIEIVANSIRYSLVKRDAETDLLPYAIAKNKLLVVRDALGGGVLSDNYSRTLRPHDLRRFNGHFRPDALERMQPILMTLAALARIYDATPSQVALAWVFSHPNTIVIPASGSLTELKMNLEACALKLTRAELDELAFASDIYSASRGPRFIRSLRTRIRI